MQLLINHIGYESKGSKQAILQTPQPRLSNYSALLVCAQNHITVDNISIEKNGEVDNWHFGHFYTLNFTKFTQPGTYYIRFDNLRSEVFEISENLLMTRTFSDVLNYFKSQRSSGRFDKQDQNISVLNSDQTMDAHGGWYDASGDVSKYLSHLSYANYLNPQQIPMVVWNMLKGLSLTDSHPELSPFSQERLIEEALFGADFLLRMQSTDGYFFMTVFDGWSKETQQREVCAYETQAGKKTSDYQAGYRQGGGVAIASLAATARLERTGDFKPNEYLQAAERGYWHLRENNRHYLDDNQENIIDEYCALLASCELFKTTQEQRYLAEARDWAQRLSLRQLSDDNLQNFWSANHDGSRPYYHAVEAGLPVIALCEYLSIETESAYKQPIATVVLQACQFELNISQRVTNPFSYPRQYVKPVNGKKQETFFMPHDNESGYWWQGENARLASMATMAYLAQDHINNPALKAELINFAQRSLDWILGLNPYHCCMLDGHGRNNPDYLPKHGFFNAKGGICNGITSGVDDEKDIAFNPTEHKNDSEQNWRWGEQWLPHSAWYLLAIMAQTYHFESINKANGEG
ncbi:chitobiase [Vibrio sp. 10N.286.49.B3]|uniref:glycoside hydrolase family 9 protein n=1 Tax=Vibrio sp. 10N.286.49.B3 TaxID=1880855 RepID=UPI000C81A9A1|nr:glycoside hydrolase family 9 protein [Vibrio sp. 10N.286.49.B3]PMH41221.1 chitobiase [Vibrio sp. 10N.286.49.B3]